MRLRINFFGIMASALLFYLGLSGKPWWILVGGSSGERTFEVLVSPFSYHVELLDRPLTVPIIPYLLLSAKLSILLAATTTLIGSILADKPWSGPMISVKGMVFPVIFLVGLYVTVLLAGYLGFRIQMFGDFVLEYSIKVSGLELLTETPGRAEITVEYWIAVAAGLLSVVAKLAHRSAGKG